MPIANAFAERARLDRNKDLKQRLEDAKHELEVAQRQGQYERASQRMLWSMPLRSWSASIGVRPLVRVMCVTKNSMCLL